MNSPMRIAVIGIGRMGTAMADRLQNSGFSLTLFSRNSARAQTVAANIGAQSLERIDETCRWVASDGNCGVIFTALADDVACREVYLGTGGLCDALEPGTVVCDTSTISPSLARELATAVAQCGASFLDTPVSGSVPSAVTGQLTVMAGGSEAALHVAMPALRAISKKVIHIGMSGSGAAMKLVVNAVVHALNQAVSEALVLAEEAGFAPAVFFDVISESAAAAPFIRYKRHAFENPGKASIDFSVDLVAKDLDLILQFADEFRVQMPELRAVRASVSDAVGAGYGASDMSALAIALREQRKSHSMSHNVTQR